MSSNNTRIARNSLMMYFRMLFSMFVGLFTSRIVLNVLGVEDYGIYNVVGGIVALFAFLNASMSTATQRYLSYEMGKKNRNKLRETFNVALIIHVGIGLLIVLFGEIGGLYLLNEELNIPVERMQAAIWVFHISIITTFLGIIRVPFSASIIANEKMDIYAYMSIVEVSLKLLLVYILTVIAFDKLILFALLGLGLTIIINTSYILYCRINFRETAPLFITDKNLFRELLSFSGWSLFGNLAAVSANQGVNILINMFYGPAINAARGIAYQVNGAIRIFVSNFQVAVNPQIIKTYAANELTQMHKLVLVSSRISFFLLFIIALPILLETEYILYLWLDLVPEYTVLFTSLIIINALVDSLSGPLMISAQATGKIKVYQIIVGGVLLLNLPISYLFLNAGFSPEVTFIINIALTVLALYLRLRLMVDLIKLKVSKFMKSVILPIIITTPLAYIIPVGIKSFLDPGFLRFLLVSMSSVLSVFILVFFFGLTENERSFLRNKINQYFKKNI
ncbi:MATE family efflux transporter [Robiginitalea sp. IMCC44478]|uniref:MATE family efflux transporter n=1 Tax=Robiginitalea sp. IMCC44478 TaxID=3459122 RepID=UPI0040414AC2